jgi:hypothetical protein
MTPQEKAIELFDKYFLLHESSTDENGVWIVSALNKGLAKKCALIAVEEILKANVVWYEGSIPYKYWITVQQEIQKL